MDRNLRLVTVFVIVLLLSVTIPMVYLLSKNIGMEKVCVTKNEVMSSDVDAQGHIFLLVRQYTKTFIGQRSADEFIKKEGIKGYIGPLQADYYTDQGPSDILLVIKDLGGGPTQSYILAKQKIWNSAVLKQYNGEIYLAWDELHFNDTYYNYDIQLMFSKINANYKLDPIVVNALGPAPAAMETVYGMEIMPDPPRAVIDFSGGLFVVNGSLVKRALTINVPYTILKTQDSHLFVMGNIFNAGKDNLSTLFELDKDLMVIHKYNIDVETGYLFQSDGIVYLYFVNILNAPHNYTGYYYIHSMQDDLVDWHDNYTRQIDYVFGAPYDDLSITQVSAQGFLLVLKGNEEHYPMEMDIYDSKENFSRKANQYFNFTIQNVQQVGTASYIVGYIDEWSTKKEFPQLVFQKLEVP